MINTPYKICFLGYQKLSEMAREVIDSLHFQDTEVILLESNYDTLPFVVNDALAQGCEVFIAGSANAAEFKRRSYGQLVEIPVRTVDFLSAISRALQIGSKPAIVRYRYSAPIHMELLEQFSGCPVRLIQYEDSAELYDLLRQTDADVIIGAGFACEVATNLNIKNILAYPGEDTIRNTIERARSIAIELRSESWKNRVTQSIIDNSPFGLIVTDGGGSVMVFNSVARFQTNLGDRRVRGKQLSELVPSLSTEDFIASGERQEDRHRLINGAMIRCIHTRIEEGSRMIGVLTTLHPDNTRRRKKPELPGSELIARGKWKDIIGNSPAMQEAINTGKVLADSDYPLVITGESGSGKSFFAQCIHTGAPRSQEPYVTINAAALADQDAARLLFGMEGSIGSQTGLLEMAQGGTVVLQNLPFSTAVVQSCILQAITERSFCREGGTQPVPFRARIITITSKNNGDHVGIHDELWQRLSVLHLSIPPMRERKEDILPMFQFFLSQEGAVPRKRLHAEPAEVLQSYSWPGNLAELSAVAKRYSFLRRGTVNPTASARQLLHIQAIGEDVLLEEILRRHPALRNIATSPAEEILAGLEEMKQVLCYNNARIAEKLAISRTTLWRLTKSAEEESSPAGESHT